jgi:hypothetical protein
MSFKHILSLKICVVKYGAFPTHENQRGKRNTRKITNSEAGTTKPQVPKSPGKNPGNLGQRQTILKDCSKDAKRQKPQERRI